MYLCAHNAGGGSPPIALDRLKNRARQASVSVLNCLCGTPKVLSTYRMYLQRNRQSNLMVLDDKGASINR
jgi:hypothetical protein